MRHPSLLIPLVVVLGLALGAQAQEPAAPDARLVALRQLLAYDAKAALDVEGRRPQRRGEVSLTSSAAPEPARGAGAGHAQ